jgi:hypothetical protein
MAGPVTETFVRRKFKRRQWPLGKQAWSENRNAVYSSLATKRYTMTSTPMPK